MKPYPITKPDADVAAALGIKPHVARDWRRRGSIPAQYFHALSMAGLADLEDLAAFAACDLPARLAGDGGGQPCALEARGPEAEAA